MHDLPKLLDLAADLERLIAAVKAARDLESDRGRVVTLEELSPIMGAAGQLTAHATAMVVRLLASRGVE